ncbi:MAG: hypothetical protein ACOYLB_04130 [Phototrophicaceae bacterium]
MAKLDRHPIGDRLDGVLIRMDETFVLCDFIPTEHAHELIGTGEWMVRYGIPYLGKPHVCVVPGLVALDYGDLLNAEDAWQFLLSKSNLYPRGEVFGYRNDGEDEMIVIKKLDFSLAPVPLIYSPSDDIHPIGKLSRIITTQSISNRVMQYVACSTTFESDSPHE